MISSRLLTVSRRAPGEVLGPLGASVREALRAPRRVWTFNGVLGLACVAVWTVALRGTPDTVTQSQTFRLRDNSPFDSAGDARRASLRYAENIIDDNRETHAFLSNAG